MIVSFKIDHSCKKLKKAGGTFRCIFIKGIACCPFCKQPVGGTAKISG